MAGDVYWSHIQEETESCRHGRRGRDVHPIAADACADAPAAGHNG